MDLKYEIFSIYSYMRKVDRSYCSMWFSVSMWFQYILHFSTHRHIGIIGFHIADYLIYVSLCFYVVQIKIGISTHMHIGNIGFKLRRNKDH
jgi:hypothetical protein